MTDLLPRFERALGASYAIQRELGGGGMSRVWLARELALDRDVVIKFVGDGTGLSAERFAREVQLAARLQQANIVPLLTAGDADGVPYYTMPYVDGQSLRARLARGPLPLPEALDVLRDVARALAYAHAQGVVHRDIKPENVLLSSGAAVVTDFGIAKALRAARTVDRPVTGHDSSDGSLTQAGTSLGTPAYMAPEQALGEEADVRADLYAWGIVAYELLAGRHPFAHHATPAKLVAAHLAEAPPALPPRIPTGIAALVMRCLAKDPADRPASAGTLLETLATAATSDPAAPAAAAARDAAPRDPRRTAAVVLGVVVIAGIGWALMRGPDAPPMEDTRRTEAVTTDRTRDVPDGSIAVLPFVNLSGDAKDEYFSDGMTDELAHALQNLPGLQLAGRSSSYAFKGKNVPATEIGRTLRVRTLVEGTVRRSGTRVRIAAQLTSADDGRVLWSDVFENAGGDVFVVQDSFTQAIVAQLAPRLARGAADPGASTGSVVARAGGAESRGTTDAAAYDLYLRGRYFWAQRGAGPLDSALALFREAVRRDPQFARGWASIALTQVIRPNYNSRVAARPAFDSALIAANRALALDSTLADAWSVIGNVRIRRLDVEGAGPALQRARALEPQNANVRSWLGLWHSARGDLDQALREREAAMSLDPLSVTFLNSRLSLLYELRRFDEAREVAARVMAMGPVFAGTTVFWWGVAPAVLEGKAESLWQHQQRLLRDPATNASSRQVRGAWGGRLLLAAATARWPEARALRDTILAGAGGTALLWDRALVSLVFGTRADAASGLVASLEQEGSYGNLVMSTCARIFEAVRDEPAWRAFLARHRLPLCPLRSVWPDLRAPENRR